MNAKKLNIELPPASAARPEEAAKKLVLGEPNLQAPSDTSVGIAWTVNVLANGWVEYADNPEFANAKKTVCGGFGLTGFDDRILQVRPYKPPKVACVAPIAYTVVIEGVEKEIFYEAETGTWFSVKAIER